MGEGQETISEPTEGEPSKMTPEERTVLHADLIKEGAKYGEEGKLELTDGQTDEALNDAEKAVIKKDQEKAEIKKNQDKLDKLREKFWDYKTHSNKFGSELRDETFSDIEEIDFSKTDCQVEHSEYNLKNLVYVVIEDSKEDLKHDTVYKKITYLPEGKIIRSKSCVITGHVRVEGVGKRQIIYSISTFAQVDNGKWLTKDEDDPQSNYQILLKEELIEKTGYKLVKKDES